MSRKKRSAENTHRFPIEETLTDQLVNEVFGVSLRSDEAKTNHLKAIITHYLHTKATPSSRKTFESFALEAIELLFKKLEIPKSSHSKLLTRLSEEIGGKPFRPPARSSFTFIDLFAGIGGFRVAMQDLGGKCVFSSELDKFAKHTYAANFGEVPFGDITKDTTKALIPEKFDILCGGFPCQAFSIAGKRGGFEDTRGTLFFHIAEILESRKPKAFFLENVKGLVNHKSGGRSTLAIILNALRQIGYVVPTPRIINAKHFGVPQNRERIFIVGFREDLDISETAFSYPEPDGSDMRLESILEQGPVPSKFYLSSTALDGLKRHRARHESKGNGFGYEVLGRDQIAGAIVVGGMGRERNLFKDKLPKDPTISTKKSGGLNPEGIRTLTPREWARLQGFSDDFVIPVSDAQAYKQFGNSVAVPAIRATAKEILKVLRVRSKT